MSEEIDFKTKYLIYKSKYMHLKKNNIQIGGNSKDNIYECKKCNNYSDFTKVYIPYACKLLFQELMTMSIAPRILTN